MATAWPFCWLCMKENDLEGVYGLFSIDSYALYKENCIIIGCRASYIPIRCTWESNKMCLVFMLKINGLTSSQCARKTSNRAIAEFRITTKKSCGIVVYIPLHSMRRSKPFTIYETTTICRTSEILCIIQVTCLS